MEVPLPSNRWSGPRRAALFGLAALFGGLVLAAVITRVIVSVTPDHVRETQTAFLGRLQRSVEYLPTLLQQPGDTGVVLGCSHAMFGVFPSVFDQRLEERRHVPLRTYNLTTMSFTPMNMLYLTRRFVAESERASRKQALTLVEFCPTVATAGYENKRSVVQKSAYLISLPDLGRLFLSRPAEAFELSTLKWLGGCGPSELNIILDVLIYGDRPFNYLQRAHDALSVALRKRFGGVFPTWDPAERGGFRQVYPETKDAYDGYLKMMSNEGFQKGFTQFYLQNSDIKDMQFSERQVAAFIESVRNMQRVSKDLIVFLSPVRYSLTTPTTEGAKRRAAVIARIHAETGAEVIDLYGPSFDDPREWIDLGHLNETVGMPHLSNLLADRVAEVLGGGDRDAPAGAGH